MTVVDRYVYNIGIDTTPQMNFNHQEYVEIYSALKEGCWINHDVKEELVKRLEQYMIRVAMHNDFHPKKKGG